MEKRKEIWEYGIVTILSTIAFLAIMGCFTGKGLFDHNPYNTYALQADSWRQGRLDLSQDYPWLELAIFNEKYYCSFPPFPSYLLFPLTFIWGSNTPDFFLLFVFDLIIAAFLYKLAIQSDIKPAYGMLEAFWLCLHPIWYLSSLIRRYGFWRRQCVLCFLCSQFFMGEKEMRCCLYYSFPAPSDADPCRQCFCLSYCIGYTGHKKKESRSFQWEK